MSERDPLGDGWSQTVVLTNDIPKPPRWMRAREERGKKRKLFAFDINTEHIRELSKLFPKMFRFF